MGRGRSHREGVCHLLGGGRPAPSTVGGEEVAGAGGGRVGEGGLGRPDHLDEGHVVGGVGEQVHGLEYWGVRKEKMRRRRWGGDVKIKRK